MKRRAQIIVLALAAALFASGVPVASATDPQPSVTLSADHGVITAFDQVHLTSHVVATNLNWSISVLFPGQTEWRYGYCAGGNVNTTTHPEDETQTCQFSPGYNLKIRAQLTDADKNVKAEAFVTVGVRAKIGTPQFTGALGRSGGYVVYAKGKAAKITTTVYPPLPGTRCMRHVVQRHYASGWRTVKTSACIVEQKQGKVPWTWTGKHASRVKFRVHATFAGNALNRANVGAWGYFRFK